ncbi:MAG: hypothetical protein ACI4QL_00585 [Candidatus Fimimonas sp.]
MKKFFALARLMFVQQYRIKPNGEKKKSVIITYVVLAVCFLPMLVSVAMATFSIGKLVGTDTGVVASLILGCQGLVVLFGTASIMTIVFNGADNNKLLYMPVKPTTIFLARLATVYANEVLTSLVVVLAAILPLGIGAGASAAYFLIIPFVCLLMPMLPLLVGCLLSMPVSALLAKFKNNVTVRMIVQVLMFLVFFVLYGLMMFSMNGSMNEEVPTEVFLQNLASSLKEAGNKTVYVHADYMLATAMTVSTLGSWLLAFLCAVAENAALLGIVVLVSLPFYRWILYSGGENGSSKRKNNSQLLVQKKNVVLELAIIDFKRTMRNSQLGFQAVATVIVMPILVAFMSIVMGSELTAMMNSPIYQVVAPFVIVAYGAMLGMGSGVLGLFPISRENKSLYLLKSLPVPFDKILLAKVLLATAVMLVGDFATCVLAMIFFKVKWYYGIAMLLSLAFLGFGGMCLTTLLDVKSPKLGWENFNQSLKNSKNSFIGLLIGLICAVVLGIVFGLFFTVFSVVGQWYVWLIMWIVIIGLCAGFAAVCYNIMKSKAARHFEKIEP